MHLVASNLILSAIAGVGAVSFPDPSGPHPVAIQAAAMGLSNETFAELIMGVCDIASIKGYSSKLKSTHNIARLIASRGYVVITVDHPYDTAVVEFPDGSIIETADIPEKEDDLTKLTKVRAEDLSFGLPRKINFDNIVVYGHSLGGSSAAVAMLSDSRFRSGANLDGRFVKPALSKGPKQPFLMLGRPNHRTEDATWVTFWKNLRGPKAELAVAGIVHGAFTDVPLLITALGLPTEVKAQISSIISTIDAQQLEKVLIKTLTSFFTYAFDGKPKPFIKAVQAISELSIVNSQLPNRS
ncbi:hypothetical protein BGZ61DRAFT_548651 [Ilyonectria robusta]|uniref:uncharacterized protein n=1 Tax=Ilyonectria robusta TaxID=1079257 RepID=UPI001E8CD8D9|nr:uncharacterized protein BGZ61DRAFT_548651 [Ilyonectria robusta]KAH8647993.1 hypothetical protein BGZ61DRAFT_548651 [Ilyonectria robusta]